MDKVRVIEVLLFEDLNLLDVAGPVQAFSSANDDGAIRYRLRYVSLGGGPITSSCGLRLHADGAFAVEPDHDLLVPGGRGVDRLLQQPELQMSLRDWAKPNAGGRVISICSGALILADAALLDGRSATTHWARAKQVRDLYPRVNWDTEKLYKIDDPIFTSAGVTSGIDLALEIVRRDHGSKVALSVARELVVYLKRSGGQSQFADVLEAQFTEDKALYRLISALHENPGAEWTLDRMADVAGLTPRTLVRRFSAMIGCSPVKFLEKYRVKRASDALSSGLSIARSIQLSGFRDFQQMQRAFKRRLGTTVGGYADRFVR